MAHEEVIVIEGLLDKKKKAPGFFAKLREDLSWNHRWFCVSVNPDDDQFTLSYCEKRGAAAKWSRSIAHIKDVYILDDDDRIFEIVFRTTVGEKALQLRSGGHDDFEMWINCLTKFVDDAARQLKKEGKAAASKHKTADRLKTEMEKAKAKAGVTQSKIRPFVNRPSSGNKASTGASCVQKELEKAKAKAEAKANKSKTMPFEAAKEAKCGKLPPDPEVAARLKARRAHDIAKAREQARKRIAKTKALEAEAKVQWCKEEAEKKKGLSAAEAAKRGVELAAAKKRAEDRVQKQTEKTTLEKKNEAAAKAGVNPVVEARQKAQREKELEEARLKAEVRSRARAKEKEQPKKALVVHTDPALEEKQKAQREKELEEARKKAEARNKARANAAVKRTSTSVSSLRSSGARSPGRGANNPTRPVARSKSPAARKLVSKSSSLSKSTKAPTGASSPDHSSETIREKKEHENQKAPKPALHPHPVRPSSAPANKATLKPKSPAVKKPSLKPSSSPATKKPGKSAAKCELCDEVAAVVTCHDCGDLQLCRENGCDTDMHSGSKKRHERIEIEVKVKKFSQMIYCYLCGQQFTNASLPIHYGACKIKRRLIYKEVSEDLRPPFPKPPESPMPSDEASRCDFKKFNDEAHGIYKEAMCQCPNDGCGRRFEPDRIGVHMRGCRFRDRSRMD